VIACVATTPAVDRFLRLDGPVRTGTIHRPAEVVAVAGGKGLNAARSAAALGAEVIVVAPLGGHGGRWIAAELEREGIEVRAVPVRAEPRVCVSVAGRGGDGELTEFYEPAPAMTEEEWFALELAVTTVAEDVGWVTLSGSLPPGAPPGGHGRLVSLARAGGARVALDAHGDALRAGLAEGPDLVKVNAEEAEELGGPGAGAAALRERAGGGERAAAVTHGPGGIELAAAGEGVLRAAPPVTGAYPVGCGDAALAGMVTALDLGGGWPAALLLGVGASAAAAEVPGAGRLDGARARELALAVARGA
jgi:1-phosphofructokinase family hexose kinase